jgi:hypothetical protein
MNLRLIQNGLVILLVRADANSFTQWSSNQKNLLQKLACIIAPKTPSGKQVTLQQVSGNIV